MLSTVSDAGGEPRENQISDTRSDKAIRHAVSGLQCRLPVTESCTLPRIAAVDLIGHSELYGVIRISPFV